MKALPMITVSRSCILVQWRLSVCSGWCLEIDRHRHLLMIELIASGDTVIGKGQSLNMRGCLRDLAVRGKRRKDTVLICLSQDDVEEGKIAMNKG